MDSRARLEDMVAGENPVRRDHNDPSSLVGEGRGKSPSIDSHETSPAAREPESLASLPSPLAPLTPAQLTIASARLTALRRWRELKSQDPTLTIFESTPLVGLRGNALWKLVRKAERIESEGRALALADLAPRGRARAKRQPTGSVAAWALQQAGFVTALETFYAATIGAASDYTSGGRRTGSVTTALLRVAEDPCCPEALANTLQAGRQPKPLVAHLRRRFTPEIESRLRGEKHFQLHGLVSRRDHTVRLPDGRRCEITSGFLVEFDDMSSNQPFYVELSDGTWILSRQGLYARDLKSKRWLGVELIARPREAYRAADILRFLRRLMQDYGKFDVLRLEHGVWAARSIQGYILDPSHTSPESLESFEQDRPEMPEAEQQALQAGLAALGCHLDYARDAHDKVIESGFNYLQTVLATYTTDYVNIGRHAGEFEIAAKRMRQARSESRHPRDLGFAPMDDLANRILQAFTFINRKPSGSKTPDTTWSEDMEQRPLSTLTTNDLAAFLPEVREATIQGGRVTVQVRGVPHDFRAERLIELGHGYRVFLRFDSSEPTLGAAIYNRETSSANYGAHAQGDFLCWAAWEMPAPQCDLDTLPSGLEPLEAKEIYGAGTDARAAVRNKQEAFVRTAYRSLPKPGRPPVQVAEARDGHGRLSRVERSVTSPESPESPTSLSSRARPRLGALPMTAVRRTALARQAELARELSD